MATLATLCPVTFAPPEAAFYVAYKPGIWQMSPNRFAIHDLTLALVDIARGALYSEGMFKSRRRKEAYVE